MKQLLKYLKPYQHFVLFAPAFVITAVVIELFVPKLMSKIINDGVINKNFDSISNTGIVMLVLIVLAGIFETAGSFFSSAAANGFEYDLRNDLFRKIMSLSVEQKNSFPSGALINRLTANISNLKQLIEIMLKSFARLSAFFAGSIIMMMTLDISFGIIMIAALFSMLICGLTAIVRSIPLYKKIEHKRDAVTSAFKEAVSGVHVIKAFVNEDYEADKFSALNEDLSEEKLLAQKIWTRLNPILFLIMNLSAASVVFIGGFKADSLKLNVGDIMAAVTYISQLLMSVMMLNTMLKAFSQAKVSAKKINEVLFSESIIKDGENDKARLIKRGEISFRNVNFSYPNSSGIPVLRGISLDIKRGESFAFLGTSGSGKTTLVNLIARFYDVTDGDVFVDSISVKEYPLYDLREKIGIVLQTCELFYGTVKDNILWGCSDKESVSEDDIIRAAKIAQADDFINEMPNGYETNILSNGKNLSGGQKQRLCIARAIVKKPEILILDDCTSALDLTTEAKLHNALKTELKGMTVIKIAQRIASVKGCDRIAVIDNGMISAVMTHEKLMLNSQRYRDIYASQHGNGVDEIRVKTEGFHLDINEINDINDIITEDKNREDA